MKEFWKIITNPIGIALVVGHWIFAVFAFPYNFSRSIGGIVSPNKVIRIFDVNNSIGVDCFIIINSYSIAIIKIAFKILSPIFDKALDVDKTAFNFFAVCSTFQWLLFGYLLSSLMNSYRKTDRIKIF